MVNVTMDEEDGEPETSQHSLQIRPITRVTVHRGDGHEFEATGASIIIWWDFYFDHSDTKMRKSFGLMGENLAEARRELYDKKQEVKSLTADLAAAKGTIAHGANYLGELQENFATSKSSEDKLKGHLARYEAEMKVAKDKLLELSGEVNRAEKALKQRTESCEAAWSARGLLNAEYANFQVKTAVKEGAADNLAAELRAMIDRLTTNASQSEFFHQLAKAKAAELEAELKAAKNKAEWQHNRYAHFSQMMDEKSKEIASYKESLAGTAVLLANAHYSGVLSISRIDYLEMISLDREQRIEELKVAALAKAPGADNVGEVKA